MQTLEQLIAASRTFRGLDDEYLSLIAGCAVNERLDAGAELFHEGDPARRFYLIRAGSLALELQVPGRGTVIIETLHAGDVAGWSWLFEPHRWQFDARAPEPTALIAFDGTCLRGKCESDHELGYELMRRFAGTLTERLQAARLQLLDVYGHGRGE